MCPDHTSNCPYSTGARTGSQSLVQNLGLRDPLTLNTKRSFGSTVLLQVLLPVHYKNVGTLRERVMIFKDITRDRPRYGGVAHVAGATYFSIKSGLLHPASVLFGTAEGLTHATLTCIVVKVKLPSILPLDSPATWDTLGQQRQPKQHHVVGSGRPSKSNAVNTQPGDLI